MECQLWRCMSEFKYQPTSARQDQYQFVYRAALEYLNSFDHYVA